MTIDFHNIPIAQMLGSEPVSTDCTDFVANTLYHSALDLWQDELARRIYAAKGPVELDDREKAFAQSVMEAAQLPVYIKRPILDAFNI